MQILMGQQARRKTSLTITSSFRKRYVIWRQTSFNPFTVKFRANSKLQTNLPISFSQILKNKIAPCEVRAESFYLNGHIIGLKESPHKTLSSTLIMKGLNRQRGRLYNWKASSSNFFWVSFLGCLQQCSFYLSIQLTQENHGIVESKEKRELCMHLLDSATDYIKIKPCLISLFNKNTDWGQLLLLLTFG